MKALPFILVFLVIDAIVGWFIFRRWRDHRYDVVLVQAARKYGVDPSVVKAVAWRESRFDPSARGRAGEVGLMQIREPAAREWAAAERLSQFHVDMLLDPRTNAQCGAWYLAKLLRRYKGTDNPLPFALADYNAGRSHVLRWNGGAGTTNSIVFIAQITFPGTVEYIRAVAERQQVYAAELALN